MSLITGDKSVEFSSIGGGYPLAVPCKSDSSSLVELAVVKSLFDNDHHGHRHHDDCCDRDYGRRGRGWDDGYSRLESIHDQINAHDISNKFDNVREEIRDGKRDIDDKINRLDKDICELGHEVFRETDKIKDAIRWGDQKILDEIRCLEDRRKDRELSQMHLESTFYKKGFFDGSGPVMVAHQPSCEDKH